MQEINHQNITAVSILGPEYADRDVERRHGSARGRYRIMIVDETFEWIDPDTRSFGRDDLVGDVLRLDDAIHLAYRYIPQNSKGDLEVYLTRFFEKRPGSSMTFYPHQNRLEIRDTGTTDSFSGRDLGEAVNKALAKN